VCEFASGSSVTGAVILGNPCRFFKGDWHWRLFWGESVHFQKVWVCAVDVVINNAILLVRDRVALWALKCLPLSRCLVFSLNPQTCLWFCIYPVFSHPFMGLLTVFAKFALIVWFHFSSFDLEPEQFGAVSFSFCSVCFALSGIKDCFGGERGGGMFSQELRSCSAP